MEIWQALVLGVVQGSAEFLPISSSGHLLLTREILGISGDYLLFDVLLHVATLGAVAVHFRKDIIDLFVPPYKRLGLLVVATIPAVIAGGAIKLLSHALPVLEELTESSKYLRWFFLLTAVMMIVSEWLGKNQSEPKPFGVKAALGMGLMQVVGVLPGVSRSGSTMFGGLLARAEKSEIATFSFLMSIPIILGSAFVEGVSVVLDGSLLVSAWCYVMGMAASFTCGYFAVGGMMKIIKNAEFKWFGVYLIAVGVVAFII